MSDARPVIGLKTDALDYQRIQRERSATCRRNRHSWLQRADGGRVCIVCLERSE